jgi:regulator of replication initiation timing
MRTILIPAIIAMMLVPLAVPAAERAPSQARIEAARITLNDFKAKAVDSKAAATDIDEAAGHLDKAAAALKAGEKMFGGVSDEADLEVRHETNLADLVLKRGNSRLEQAKIGAESAVLAKKIDVVKAKVKIFDDFRAEISRLKGEVAASGKVGKELDTLKGEKNSLEEQVAKLTGEKEKFGAATAEIGTLKLKLDSVTEENKKLKGHLEKLEADKKRLTETKVVPPAPKPSAAQIKEAEPQQELVTAPTLKIDDAAPQIIAPAEDQKSQ